MRAAGQVPARIGGYQIRTSDELWRFLLLTADTQEDTFLKPTAKLSLVMKDSTVAGWVSLGVVESAGDFGTYLMAVQPDLEAGDELAGMSAAERYEFVVQHIPAASREDFRVEVTKAAFEAVERVSIGHLAHVLGGWEATAWLYAHPEVAAEVRDALAPDEGPGTEWRDLEQGLCGG